MLFPSYATLLFKHAFTIISIPFVYGKLVMRINFVVAERARSKGNIVILTVGRRRLVESSRDFCTRFSPETWTPADPESLRGRGERRRGKYANKKKKKTSETFAREYEDAVISSVVASAKPKKNNDRNEKRTRRRKYYKRLTPATVLKSVVTLRSSRETTFAAAFGCASVARPPVGGYIYA